jgi:hypothetical protein
MDKKTKMWVGVAVVAAAAYYFWNKSKTPATTTTKQFVAADGIFANTVGHGSHSVAVQSASRGKRRFLNAGGCASGYTPVTTGSGTICTSDGYNYKPYPGFRPPARFTAFAPTDSTGQVKH